MFIYFLNIFARYYTITWKRVKRLFKNKEDGDPFLKTVKVSDLTNGSFESFRILKMKLDTGCEAHDLVSSQAVRKLGLMAMIKIDRRPICVCLNGQELISVGTIELQWKGKSFRSIFSTRFEVIEGEVLPWDIVLGAKTIEKHGILKFCGFGGRRIHPLQSEEEKSREARRRDDHKKKSADNDAKVEEDKKRRKGDKKRDNNKQDETSGKGASS